MTLIQPQLQSGRFDAFSRERVSSPETLFDSKQIHDNLPLFYDDQEVSGGGTSSTYSQDNARSRLAVSADTAGKRVRQTFMRFNYQPGKSQYVLMTGVLGVGESGITQELGLFDDDNGLFFQCADAEIGVVIRSSTSGSAVDTRIAQSSWNVDTMNGKGSSRVTLDFSKTLIFFVDFSWLGVGHVRFGFVLNGMPVVAHEFKNSNSLAVVYMSTPNLPLRYTIENDGTAGANFLDHLCSTVISEGGVQDTGVLRHAETGNTHLDANATNTSYALLGIRLKSTHLGAMIEPLEVSINEYVGTKFYAWHWLLNPTVADTFTYAAETNSAVEIARGATANTVTGGTHLGGNVASSAQKGSSTVGTLRSALHLGSAIDGTRDELVLAVILRDDDINAEFAGSLLWREGS